MHTCQTIHSRRSIRRYTGEPVTSEQLDCLLASAYATPVGMGRFEDLALTVVTSPRLLAEIDACAALAFGDPQLRPLYGAPLLIVVSARVPSLEQADNVSSANVAMAIHSMALAAVDMGLGQCVIYGAMRALVREPALLAQLELPEGFTPLGSIVVGATDERYEPREVPAGRIATNYVR